MLIKEQVTTHITRYYSDNNKYIRRLEDGRLFVERYDGRDENWTYEESNFNITETQSEGQDKEEK